ncbi:MAG TPA: CARDB domain-containing protein [Tepidisphaeraceae bacterium]|jgi:hypothetical protein
MSRRQTKNRARKLARAIELEGLEVRQLLSSASSPPDLITSNAVLTTSTVNCGDQDTVNFTVTNIGSGQTTSSWQDAVYATTNSTYIAGDASNVRLGSSGDQGLDVNDSYQQSISFGTGNLNQGTYHIFVVANDDDGESDETNTSNNSSETSTDLTVNQPDLVTSNVQLQDTTLSQGQTSSVSWTVQNLGPAPAQQPDAGYWYDDIVAVPTADGNSFNPNDPNDKYLNGPGNPNGLDVGASYNTSSTFNTDGWAPGTYNIFVIANDGKWFQESDFNNNVAEATQQLTVTVPDLTVTDVSAQPTTLALNKTLTVSWSDTNSASATGTTENGWIDVIWISPSSTLDTTSPSAEVIYYAGTPTTPILAPGQSYPMSVIPTIPTNIDPGQYYIFIQTNQYSGQGESDTTNDISAAIPVTITAADLVVTNAQAETASGTVASNFNVGDPLVINWTVKNQGNAQADGTINSNGGGTDWNDGIYWSYSPVFNTDAHEIGTVDYNTASPNTPLLPGQSYTQSTANDPSISTPFYINTSNWDGGQYYFFVKTDDYGWQQPEGPTGENNNVSAPISVYINAGTQPDLTASLNSAPSTANTGQTIPVDFTITNGGTASTAGNTWTDTVYLSTSSTFLQSQSTAIGYIGNGYPNPTTGQLPLNPGDSYTQDENLVIPAGSEAGQQYIFVVTDSFQNLQETNGANNVSNSIPIFISGSDETVTDFNVNANSSTYDPYVSSNPDTGNVEVGTPIDFQWTVQNQGNLATQNQYSDAIYLSPTNTFDPAKSLLVYSGTEAAGFASGDSYTNDQTFSISSNLPDGPGTYYLFVVTDAFSDEAETNETNNVSLPIQMEVDGPDLQVTTASIDNGGAPLQPNQIQLDQQFNISWSVQNQGDQSANGGWYDSIYISTSPTFDPSNSTQLFTFQPEPGGLNGGNSSYGTGLGLTLDSYNYNPGQYYIYVVTDDGNQVAETNENNNVYTIPVTVLGADLTVTSASADPTVTSDGNVTLNWTVQNQGGSNTSTSWSDAYYISDSSVFNSSTAQYIGSNHESNGVNAGDSYSDSASFNVTNYVSPGGTYYLFVVTNSTQNQGENSYTNNVSNPVQITVDSSSTTDLSPTINSVTNNVDSSANTATVGQYFTVDWTDNNVGSTDANGFWQDQLWLSPTPNFDPNTAISLGPDSGGGAPAVRPIIADPIIANNSSEDSPHSFYMPVNIGTGTFYLFIQVDSQNTVDETTNTNNFSAPYQISVQGADLTVSSSMLSLPASTTAPDGSAVYPGGLNAQYYGPDLPYGAGSNSGAEDYISNNQPAATFLASQVQYPAFYGPNSSDGDNDTLRTYLGSDANSLNNPSVGSNFLDGEIFEFTGYVYLPQGATSFTIGSDDGSELFVGDMSNVLVNDDDTHSLTTESGTFNAPSAGLYPIKFIAWEGNGNTGVTLGWTDPWNDGNQGNFETIPSNYLYSSAPDVTTNQPITINWTDTNNGNAATQNTGWTDAIYVSPTSTFDPNTAILIGTQSVSPGNLDPNSIVFNTQSVIIPGNVGAGLKYFFVQVDQPDQYDQNGVEPEGNEDNNLSDPIPVIVSYENADLEPTSFTAPGSGVLGESLSGSLSWTVINNGSQNADGSNNNNGGPGDWHDTVYLSQNPWVDSTSISIGSIDVNQYGINTVYNYGNSYSLSVDGSNFQVPSNVAAGNYYLILDVNSDAGQGESDYTDNQFVRTITIANPNDDLIISDASINGADLVNPLSPPVVAPGQNVSLDFTVENIGSADATNTFDNSVYISSDSTFNSADATFLGDYPLNGLTAGDSASISLNETIPYNLNPGTYYLYFVANSDNAQPETDTINNILSAQISIAGPDLVVTSVSAQPAQGNVGDQFTANWTVLNQGQLPANGGWYDYVYVSASPTFDNTAIFVSSVYTYQSPLAVNGTYTNSSTFTMPGGLTAGTAYVYVVADGSQYIYETNNNNNTSAGFPVTIEGGPDLEPQNVSLGATTPTPTVVNSSLPVSWSDANIGTSSANATWYDYIYISSDSTFDYNAQSIGSVYVNPQGLAAGSSIAESANVTIPSTLAPGTYYIYVRTDTPLYYESSWGQQAEINENNNVSASIAITVNRGDLAITGTPSISTNTFAVGQHGSAQWTVTNIDPTYTVAGSWGDYVFISTTPDLSSGYVADLVSNNDSNLAPGASVNYANNFTIPDNIAAGNYYLILVANYGQSPTETSFTNNIVSFPITITNPDLTVTSVQVTPNPVSISDGLTVTYTVKNIASTSAYGGWYDAVWLTLDGKIDSSAIGLGYQYIPNSTSPVLSPAGTVDSGSNPLDQYTVTDTFTVPSWIPEGNYTVIVVADGGAAGESYYYGYYNYDNYNNQLAETNENNNSNSTTVVVGQPNLVVENATAQGTANSGDSIPVSFTVANVDSVSAAQATWYDGVYLSTTQSVTGNSVLLGSWEHSASSPLATNSSYNLDENITIPENTAPGNYYLIFATDIYNQQAESNESDNTQVSQLTVSAPDLAITSHTAPTQAIIGQAYNVSWTVQNEGTVPANGPWYDNVYLINNGNATYVGQIYAPYVTTLPLAPNGTYSPSINITIPGDYPVGSAELEIVTNYYNDQAETSTSNNTVLLPIDIEAPDLAITSSSVPSVAVQGLSMAVSYTVTNQGTSVAPNAWTDRISLSTDGTLANAVYSVDIPIAGDLANGTSYSITNELVNIPSTLATGNYHVLITTDYYNNQPEVNENNNTVDAGTVSITNVDLVPTASVENEPSGGKSTGLTAYYYYTNSSGVGSLTGAETYIAAHNPDAEFVSTQVQYPAGQGIGSSDSDSDTLGGYLGTDGNTLNNPGVKSNTLTGQIIVFEGYVALPAGNTTLWIGSDDGAELFINGNSTPLINNDGVHGLNWASAVYDAPSAGLYPIKMVYFEDGGSTGVDLAWNDSSGNRVLIPTSELYQSAATLVVNSGLTVDYSVQNNGTTTALGSWTDRISISPDDNPADAVYYVDIPASGSNGNNLAPGGEYSSNQVINLPGNLPQGVYHVLFTTDETNSVLETNENNNTVDAGLISVDSTDLTVTNPSGPALAIIGSTATINWTVKNDGSYPAQGPWVDNVYVSPDGNLADATLVGQYFSTSLPTGTLPLAAGSSYTVSDTVNIPANLPTGNYTVLIETDGYNQVPETNENNNIGQFAMEIGAPDLTITTASADSNAPIGTNMNVSWTVSNDGTSAAPDNWTDTVYLTPDGNIGDAVETYNFAQTGGLAANGSYTNNETLAIPLSLTPGSYQVVIVTDSANTQPETNENNNSYNVGSVLITAPDLTITNLTAPTTGTPGGSAAISWTVKNAGNGATSSNWVDYVYYSPDGQLSDATYLAGYYTPTTPLAAGSSYTQSENVTIPGTISGSGFIIVVTDAGNSVTESNESNNSDSSAINVSPVSVSINSPSMQEGNSGATNMVFTVTLSAATGTTENVEYFTQNGTATAGTDFQGVSSSLTFGPGVTQQTISVPIYGDTDVEDDETFGVVLAYPTGLTLGANSTGTGTIVNDDFGGQLEFSTATYSVTQGTSGSQYVTITVNRTGGNAEGVSVPYSVTAGTAVDGEDFQSSTGMLAFGANQSSATFNVQVFGSDEYGAGGSVNLTLGAPATAGAPADSTAVATLGSPATAVLNINSTVAEPAISISNYSADEGNSGLTPFTFNVTLSNPSRSTVTVNYNTADGTATVANNDYQPNSGTLTFAAGTTSQPITVNVVGDTVQEADETFYVNLSGPVGATLSTSQGTGTILNDDSDTAPTIVSTDNISGLRKSGQIGTFHFTLSKSDISDPSTWGSNFITLTDNGGTVDTSSLTVTGSAGSYQINGLDALTTTPGSYTLTLNASALTDTQSESGVGSSSQTFVIDTAPSVSINQPTVTGGVNATLSDSGSFIDPDGAAGDSWTATVDYGDGSGAQSLTLNGNNFTLSHAYSNIGDYTVSVLVTDSLGETGNDTASFDVVNGPTITSLQSVASVVTGGVPSLNVTFSEAIDPSTFTSSDITLTRNGAAVDTSSLSIASDGGNTYTINGLSGLTSSFGAYDLTVSAAGVNNTSEVAGAGSASDSWQEDTAPSIITAGPGALAYAVNAQVSGTVSFSDPDPSPPDGWIGTINYGDSTQGALTAGTGQSYTFNHTYTAPGTYTATVTVQDAYGQSDSKQFNIQVDVPVAIASLQSISGVLTSGVPNVVVTFTEPVNASTISSAITLTRGGASVDTSSLSITSNGGNSYTISNLAPLTGAFGAYTLSINAADIQNTDGVNGTGSASDSWQEDTAPVTKLTAGTLTGVEGSAFSDTGSFTDPDPSPTDSWTATINYGDGSGTQPLALSGNDFSFNHVFSKYGVYDVDVTVTDAFGLSSTAEDVVTVTQTPVTITVPANAKVNINTPLTFTGTAVDSNANDPAFSLAVDYGDGTGSHPLTLSGNSYTLNPDYTVAGRYTVTLTATDQDGTTSTNSFVVTAVPNIRPIVVNDGRVQRSSVSSITVMFDDNVNVTTNSFTVINTTTNAALPYTIQQVDGKTYELVFVSSGSIADGHYSVTINGANITDTAGDTLLTSSTQTFWRRFGDMYGNGYVTLADLQLMQSLVGKTSTNDANWATDQYLDYNGDNAITSADLTQLAVRYGIKGF